MVNKDSLLIIVTSNIIYLRGNIMLEFTQEKRGIASGRIESGDIG